MVNPRIDGSVVSVPGIFKGLDDPDRAVGKEGTVFNVVYPALVNFIF